METGDAGVYIIRRLLGLAADIIVGGGIIALILAAVSGRAAGASGLGIDARFVLWWLLAFAGTRWIFEGLTGSTPGKLVFGLAVARSRGGSAGLARALVRTILLPLDLALIGFLIAAIDPKKRRLGDLLAGTRVGNTRIGVLAPLLGLACFGAGWFGFERIVGDTTTAENMTGLFAATAAVWGQYVVTHGFNEPPQPTPAPSIAPTSSPTPTIAPSSPPTPSGVGPTPAPTPSFESGPTT